VDILTGSDVTIYVWYSAGGGLSQPAASSTYGSQAVWDSNFNSVAHFGDGTTLNLVESTSNGHTATNHSGVAGAGKYGGGVSFGSASNYLDWPSGSAPSGATDATIEFWFKGTSGLVLFDQGDFSSAGHRCLIYEPSSVTVADCFGQSVISSSGNPKDGSWHLIQVQAFNSTVIFHIYFDGASVSTGTPAANKSTVATPILLSQSVGGGNGMVGVFDEFRASHVLRSADWILTNYRTQNSPGTFTLAGTPVSGGTGSGSLFKSGTLDGLSAGGPFFSNPIG
jgi:hypothetical protein